MCEHNHYHEDEHEHGHEHSHEHNNEANSLPRIFAAIIILLVAILTKLSGIPGFVLFCAAYLVAGGDVLLRAFKNIIKGEVFDENFLMGIATLGAFAIKEYPEAVMVMILYQIGEYFQDSAVKKSRKSITDLMDIRPDYANIEENGKLVQVSPNSVKIDDIIVVTTGEKIPLDGVVVDGKAVVDTSALTGESVPRTLNVGDIAVSGCINTNGVIRIKVNKEFVESTVSKILQLVENASSKKAATENFITKFARYYTPVVVVAAILLAFLPPLLAGAQFSLWFQRALTFLVISCPCALVISVPLGFFAGIGGASRCGILIKGSSYLEALARPDSVVFDKTGTLTKGSFKVTEIVPQNGISEEQLLEYTAMAENYSNHPIALSVKKAYGKNINSNIISDVSEIAGNGLKANVNGDIILAGNAKLMNKFGIPFAEANAHGTVVYTAKNGVFIGYIVISDELKENSKQAVANIQKLADKVVMLTGDTLSAAKYMAEELNIKHVYAQLLPAGKVQKLEELISSKKDKSSVIFVGDGINDAPVLTRADVGIAMGALGSDAAIEAADVVIMDDNLAKIGIGIDIARRTMTIVKQNIAFAIGVKILFLILGAFGFISMWGAVFADVGVTLIAVLNSLRALMVKCYMKK